MMDSRRLLKTSAALLLCAASAAHAEDGYRLWLGYRAVPAFLRSAYRADASELVVRSDGPAAKAASAELTRAIPGLLGATLPRRMDVDRNGAIVLALASSPEVRPLRLHTRMLGDEGYLIRSSRLNAHRVTLVVGNSDTGLLYGTFALLRRMQTGQQIAHVDIRDRPSLPLRLLDHWDNLDRSVERGYAGQSIWNWSELPSRADRRYIDYARANASVGINGAVLNNVNADPKILTLNYLKKVAGFADLFRPYRIRVYLSVRFSSPIEVGGLKTADPADPSVQQWWRDKANEIYALIPDFGGFVVKANSEGQPGPQDYHRTHADGANVIAQALEPHGGTVFWRAFVYGPSQEDRAMQAYEQFRPLDGKFDKNVVLQVKNGPIDFQPREPFHPLFGQMPHTRLALEAQITREYLGQNTGVVYLGPMWTEVLRADTCAPRCGTPVSRTISAMAGVSNVGTDRNWTGTLFDQANWYAFGRLSWNPQLSAKRIAAEWAGMTWTNNARAVGPITKMMMQSREAVVDFMTPLGLAHQMATDHHYGPAPWVCDLKQPSWNPCYYSRADALGIGFDRVSAAISRKSHTDGAPSASAQYMPPVEQQFDDLATVPDKYLLWFHHLPWTYRMRSGGTLWSGLVTHYDLGVRQVAGMSRTWRSVRPYIDPERRAEVASDLRREQLEARWWRDASIAYFDDLSKLPLPKGARRPAHGLGYYQALKPPGLPGQHR